MVQSSLGKMIKEKEVIDPILMKFKSNIGMQKVMVFKISSDDTLLY